MVATGERVQLILADTLMRDGVVRTRLTAYDLRARRRTGRSEVDDADLRCAPYQGILRCKTSTWRMLGVDPVTARVSEPVDGIPNAAGPGLSCGLTREGGGWRVEADQVLRVDQRPAGELAPGAAAPFTAAYAWFVSDGVTGAAILVDGAPIVGSGSRLTGLDATGAVRWQADLACHAATELDGALILATGRRDARVVVLDGRTGAIVERLRVE